MTEQASAKLNWFWAGAVALCVVFAAAVILSSLLDYAPGRSGQARTRQHGRPVTDPGVREKLRSLGYDPDTAVLVDEQELEEQRLETIAKALRKLGVRYAVMVRDQVFYSSGEPKPYGSGYRFTTVPGGTQMTVSGDVTIIKLRTK